MNVIKSLIKFPIGVILCHMYSLFKCKSMLIFVSVSCLIISSLGKYEYNQISNSGRYLVVFKIIWAHPKVNYDLQLSLSLVLLTQSLYFVASFFFKCRVTNTLITISSGVWLNLDTIIYMEWF